MKSIVLGVMSLAMIGGTASAQDHGPKKRKQADPNETICKSEEVLGSRLQSRKVCMTRAQWAEQRQIDRQNVERSQTSACQRQAGC